MRRMLFCFSLVAMTLSADVLFPPPTNQIQIVYGNNQATLPNALFVQPMTVQVMGPDGNPVSGLTVTFTLPPLATGVAGATFPGAALTATVVTNSQGFATSPAMTADSPTGNFTALATIPHVPATQFQLTTRLYIQPDPPVVTPSWLAYSMVVGDKAPAVQTLSVLSNPVNFYTAATDSAWVKLNPRTYNLLDVAVDPAGMAVGHYEGLIMVSKDSAVRVRFDILAKPTIDASVTSMSFTYSAGAATLPLTQSFTVGSSVRTYNIEVNPAYTSPKTGSWLGVASRRGMTLPITLTAVIDPRGLAPGTYLGTIQIIGEGANSPFPIAVTLVVTQYHPPANRRIPQIGSFANAASFLDGAIGAGELVRLAGASLACASAPSVLVNGHAAQVLSAGDQEISLVVPDGLPSGDRVPVQVSCGDATSDTFTVPVAYAAPALFAAADTQALGYNQNLNLNGADTPAARGSVLTVYGTGFGGLDDADQHGVRNFIAPVSVTVAGEPAEVISAGPASDMPGVVQLRVRVPASAPSGSAVEFAVMSGLEKAQVVRTIAVQ